MRQAMKKFSCGISLTEASFLFIQYRVMIRMYESGSLLRITTKL
jgi:hypothetical protein